jgi:uridylate kinase
MDNELPILVLDMWQADSLTRALKGHKVGTVISD